MYGWQNQSLSEDQQAIFRPDLYEGIQAEADTD